MILEKAGHRVLTAYTVHEVKEACSREPIDVAVIGQGIPQRERLRVSDLVRSECPAVKLLELYFPWHGKKLSDADDWMEAPSDVPAELADRVTALAGRRR
jgi:hypothetical protein